MLRKYNNEEEIYGLLESFETGMIGRDEWKHAEHLVVALCYLRHDTLDGATAKMRNGIFNLLRAFGVDLEKEMPYHETITVFWMRTAYAYMLMNEDLTFVEKANGLCELYDKDHPLKFYSRDLLFSDRARAEYVDPDLISEDLPAAAYRKHLNVNARAIPFREVSSVTISTSTAVKLQTSDAAGVPET